jgi:hypothetical protein
MLASTLGCIAKQIQRRRCCALSPLSYLFALIALLLSIGIFANSGLGADQVVLQLRKAGAQAELDWHANFQLPISATYPAYTVLRSLDMQTWQPVGDVVKGSIGVSDETVRLAVPVTNSQAFYRVVANVQPADDGNFGDAIFGYGTAFSTEIQSLGQLSLGAFVARYGPTNDYLPTIGFDPTTAQYWNQFQTVFNPTTNEFAVFFTNGFVVAPRLGSYSFADVYYNVFTHDLPVFVSVDSILQAWHRSYISMLEELEETILAPRLQSLVQGSMASSVSPLWTQAQGTPLANGVLDADYFLAVTRSLVTGTNNYGSLGQSARVISTLTAISNLQPAEINLFGSDRVVDFSQFTVRGHYTTSQRLQRYFRAMMWCGLADFRFTGRTNDNSLRELSGTVAMGLLMNNSGQFANWQLFDSIVQMFVGVPDSLNFAQLSDLLTAAGVSSPANVPNNAALMALQNNIMSGQLGVQNIRSGYFWSPLSRAQIKLPRAFTFMGQRFTMDTWAQGKLVFDDIIWDEDGIPGFEDKVMRRVPSALDIAFAVLGNNQTVPEIAARISGTNLTLADGRPFFRDGLRYQHNLAAVRNVLDSQGPEAWTNNIYTSWLNCLREVSPPTTSPEYPQVMRTRAWALKTVNAQLASWTELRHDTVLYAKQPYTGEILCSYPYGYVEPRVSFWARMKDMALRTKELVKTLSATGQFVFEPNVSSDPPFTNTFGAMWTNRVTFLDNFASAMTNLQAISDAELAHLPMSSNQVLFIKGIVENPGIIYTGAKTYSGWYPGLFFVNSRAAKSTDYACDRWDPVVTDVHTDPAEPLVSDPGSVLHEAVGNVHLMLIAIDCDADKMVYAGPVLSHYEFELGPTTRKTDGQWKSDLRAQNLPPQPDWTRSYLVPGPYAIPPNVN